MQQQSRVVRLLGISGSLRKNAFSTSILQGVALTVDPGSEMSVVTLENVPLYNQDLDVTPAPAGVAKLRAAVAACDVVVIATSEYNHGVPGILKNALDWASRPAFQSCFRDKPVLILSSSSASTGGVHAQSQLRETLMSMQAHVVVTREIVVGDVNEQIGNGLLTDRATLDFILQAISKLREQIDLRLAAAAF